MARDIFIRMSNSGECNEKTKSSAAPNFVVLAMNSSRCPEFHTDLVGDICIDLTDGSPRAPMTGRAYGNFILKLAEKSNLKAGSCSFNSGNAENSNIRSNTRHFLSCYCCLHLDLQYKVFSFSVSFPCLHP